MDLQILKNEIDNDPMQIGYAACGQDYAEIAALINKRPPVENPEPQADVPYLPSWCEVLAAMTRQERVAILRVGTFQQLAIRQWEAGESPAIDLIVEWIAGTPAVQFESVSVPSLADALLADEAMDELAALVAVLAVDPGLSEAALGTLAALMVRTRPDPNWSNVVESNSRAEMIGLPFVHPTDVQAAVHWVE